MAVHDGGRGPGHLSRRPTPGGGSAPELLKSLLALAKGKKGAIYSPAIITSLWQDEARTLRVVADGDPVACIDDLLGNGNRALQDESGKRPIYHTDGSLHWLTFDASNDGLVTAPIELTGEAAVTVVNGVRKTSDAAAAIVMEFSTNSTSNNGVFAMQAPTGAVSNFGFRSRGNATRDALATGFTAPLTSVVTGLGDIPGDIAAIRVDGVERARVTLDQGSGTYGNYALNIGSRNDGSNSRLNGNWYGGVVVNGIDDEIIDAAERWIAECIGVSSETFQLRQQVTTNGGQPTTLDPGASPTMTYGLRSASPTLTGSFVPWTTVGAFTLIGGDWVQAGASAPDNNFGRARTVTTNPATPSFSGASGYVEFDFTGDEIELGVKGQATAAQCRLLINGEISGNAFPSSPDGEASGGTHYHKVAFGSVATRRLRLESIGGGPLYFRGAQVKTGQSVSAISETPLRIGIYGDSFTEGTGASFTTSYAMMLADQLGFGDRRISGSGGTGWVQTNSSPSRCNLNDRFTDDVTDVSPFMAVIAMGYNDIGDGNDAAIQAMVSARLDELIAANPKCLIHVFGPWDSAAYASNPPGPNTTSLSVAIENACAGKSNVWFHSMLGVAFEPVGGGDIHPNPAGHISLFEAAYAAIAAIHGLPAL